MHPAIFVLFSMVTSAVALAVILLIAWVSFGRPRHALSWAIAYALASALWGINLVAVLVDPAHPMPRAFAITLGAIVPSLLAIGFRQRAGLDNRLWLTVPAATLFIATAAYLGARDPGSALDRGLLPLYIAATQLVSAATLLRGGRPANPAERCMFVALLLFAAVDLALGLGVILPGGGGLREIEAYRTASMFITPTAFMVTGLFCVFLLAVDLAETMRRLATLDPLTGVLNRRGLEQAAAQAIANGRRGGQAISVVMADLDEFKQINDTRGHAAGDMALRRFSAYVEQMIRRGDLFGRVGGEEFALLLANADATTAVEVADRLRRGLAELDAGLGEMRMSCSFGVAEMVAADVGFAEVADRADGALYRSKLEGRNRVTLADRPPSPADVAHATDARQGSPLQPAPLR